MKLIKGKYLMVLIAACGISGAVLGLMINVAGVFFTPIAEDLSIGRGSVSMMLTIASLIFALAGMLSPRLVTSRNFKKLMLISMLLLAGSTMLLSLSPNLFFLYLISAVRGFSAGLCGTVLVTILINNWEATYFDFTAEKILDIARESAKLGIEMLVLDDGWFGNRFDDNRSLGDWWVNEEKLQGGLGKLVSEINALGMKFGLWFEPEMISPESGLYEEHPDWAIRIPGRRPCRARNQFVLDVGRREVRDYVLEKMFAVLHGANVEYVKWDMNRPLTDLGSADLPADRQGELCHRYVLGMYEMQERLLAEFPDLLLENCSGGGGRFDPGMLYYSPQIWCSDDTDAVERLMIQEGTSLLYPLSCMGAHVSVCPNHTVGRTTPFATRGMVALAGTFGYELDVTKLSEEDKAAVPRQIKAYHAFNDLVREGKYYRIASYLENRDHDCFQVMEDGGKKGLIFFTQVLATPNSRSRIIPLQGLKKGSRYRIFRINLNKEELLADTGRVYSGDVLMNAGLTLERPWGDFQGRLLYLEEEK